MTFSQCVHGMYDEKMEAVYRKYSQNASFGEDSESTFIYIGGIMSQKTNSAPVTENKMGTMPIGKLVFNMSLPMMISMLVQALYNIVDSIFIAKLSENALTAVSLAYLLLFRIIKNYPYCQRKIS